MVLDHKFALTVGSTLYSARTLKIKEEEGFRWVHLFYQSNCTHYFIPNIVLNTLNAGLWAHCFLCLIWAAFASCICHIFPDACYSDVLICFRTYYFYEFGREGQHAALVAAVSSGRVSYNTLKTLITCQELWLYNLIFFSRICDEQIYSNLRFKMNLYQVSSAEAATSYFKTSPLNLNIGMWQFYFMTLSMSVSSTYGDTTSPLSPISVVDIYCWSNCSRVQVGWGRREASLRCCIYDCFIVSSKHAEKRVAVKILSGIQF